MELIRVPRAVAANWWHQPWAAVVAAAEAGTDGIRRYDEKLDVDARRNTLLGPFAEFDGCFLRKADYGNGCFLFKQGW